MSGIYIPNWEKPKSCDECWAEYAYEICNSHSGTCPLIPVPDHGRLIDAAEADSRFMPDFTELSAFQRGWNAAMKRVCEDSPTIIPTDKEDGK